MSMSFADNKTRELWQNFMPQRKAIKNIASPDLYSVEVYPPSFFNKFDPNILFDKWAAMEVTDINTIPEGMESLTLPSGLYAVFLYKGPASAATETYQYIYRKWLPNSDFMLDLRPHFALMTEKYKHEQPDSEEEIWIPVKPK